MFIFKLILLLAFSAAAQEISAANNNQLLHPDEAFIVNAKTVTQDQIRISWTIAENYYLYRNKISITSKTKNVVLGEVILPPGKMKKDKTFGDVAIYRKQLDIPVKILKHNPNGSLLELLVKHQGCADLGICYPPQETTLTLKLPQTTSKKADPVSKLIQGFNKNSFNALTEDNLLPADEAFQFTASANNDNTLQLNWRIAEGYYLYREKFSIQLLSPDNIKLGDFTFPKGTPYHDEAFGNVEIFYNEVNLKLPLAGNQSAAQKLTLRVEYQGCAEIGVCYPPMQKTLEVGIPDFTQTVTKLPLTAKPQKLSDQDQIIQSLHQDSFLLTLLSFLGFGLLLSFTPCIFPMIPILSGIIVGQGENITNSKAFLLSCSYVFASAATYTIFGILAALFGSNLQLAFQEPWIIAAFSGIFILLSLSMFGFYNLEIPKGLQSYLHNSSDKHRDGSFVGAAIMGILSALIVGPCVAAPLAGALIYIGQTGDVVLGGAALFMMGLGMGFPLLILGASAGKLLPKAGTWMNSTKAVFGIIMLAVAIWMLERILPAPIIMLFWAMLLIIPAVYLSAIDPLPNNASGWRKFRKGTGILMLVYGVILLIGLSIGNINPLRPLQGLAVAGQTREHKIAFEKISSSQDLDAKLSQTAITKQWLMLDFYADWCISCKEMESFTFTDPKVQKLLANVKLVQADVTANSEEDKALLKRFNLIGPPGIIFFDQNQQQRPELRIIGYLNAEAFTAKLQENGI